MGSCHDLSHTGLANSNPKLGETTKSRESGSKLWIERCAATDRSKVAGTGLTQGPQLQRFSRAVHRSRWSCLHDCCKNKAIKTQEWPLCQQPTYVLQFLQPQYRVDPIYERMNIIFIICYSSWLSCHSPLNLWTTPSWARKQARSSSL